MMLDGQEVRSDVVIPSLLGLAQRPIIFLSIIGHNVTLIYDM
jgi:hypothetical protein